MADDHKWWEEKSEHHKKNAHKWAYVWTVYGADVDDLRSEKFIVQRKQGENRENFQDRMKLAMFIPLLSAIIDAYAGRIEGAEKKIARRWNRVRNEAGETIEEDGLGDPADRQTFAGQLWHNIDGKGTNYVPFLTKVAVLLTAKKEVWAIAEGPEIDDKGNTIKEPYVRLIHPDAVWDVEEDSAGNVIAAKVRHTVNVRESIYAPNKVVERFTVYTLDGYAVYEIREEEGGEKRAVRIDKGTGTDPLPYGSRAGNPSFYYDTPEREDTDRILPIFRVSLAMDRYPAYTLATQNVSFLNATSEVQNKHRLVCTPKLQVVADDTDQRQAQEDALTKGSQLLWINSTAQRDNKYIEPEGATIEIGMKWLSWQMQMFLFTALREYEDSARGAQKTATEEAQDAAQTEHSYLNMLAAGLDEFEPQMWKRLEQIIWPDDPQRWGQFHVERKRDFRPLDEEGEATRLHAMFFGMSPVPIGQTGRTNVAKRIGDLQDIEYDTDEIEQEVVSAANERVQEEAFFDRTFGVQ